MRNLSAQLATIANADQESPRWAPHDTADPHVRSRVREEVEAALQSLVEWRDTPEAAAAARSLYDDDE